MIVVQSIYSSTLERWPAGHVSDDLRQRHEDRVWRVRLRRRWLYVLVLLEFQSTVDRSMAVRILAYTALLYQDLLRASSEPLPPVLPIVLYDGAAQWTAATDVTALATPPGEHLAPYQPAQRYVLLDVRGYTGTLPEGRNRVAALIRLACSRGLGEMAATFSELAEWLSEPEHEGLLRAFWEWLGAVQVPAHCPGMALPVLKNWREAGTMLNDRASDWSAEWVEKGRVEGQVEGRAEGHAEIMRRVAARKFGAETARRMAERLAHVPDPERVVEVGDWLVECERGEELLERVDTLCATSGAGDEASQGQGPRSTSILQGLRATDDLPPAPHGRCR